jgi:hypothetical protein
VESLGSGREVNVRRWSLRCGRNKLRAMFSRVGVCRWHSHRVRAVLGRCEAARSLLLTWRWLLRTENVCKLIMQVGT